ncbi:MAG: cupin domain-containing protein [Gemmatimonadales bacterium]
MQTYELARLLEQRAAGGRRYLEFLRVPALSAGIYVLRPGEPDPQQPHERDELYYIIAGRAELRVGTETRSVAPRAPTA